MRNEGLFATAGRPDPVLPPPPVGPLVAIAVGKTKEGESLPAKPVDHGVSFAGGERLEGADRVSSSPCRFVTLSASLRIVWKVCVAHLSMTTAGVWLAMVVLVSGHEMDYQGL